MLSQEGSPKFLKQTEKTVDAILNQIECSLWDRVAIKAIQKMPKHVLTAESVNMLKDFAFVNSQMQLKADDLQEEDEKMSPGRDKQLAGFAELIQRHIEQSAPKLSQEVPRKLPTHRKKKHSDPAQIQETVLSTSAHLGEIKTNSFFKLFISETNKYEETKREDSMRVNKREMFRYNHQMEKAEREQGLINEQRKLIQQKKVREAKQFTYDYQGKIMSVPTRKGGNIKVFNIKSFLKTAPKIMPKLSKANLEQKLYNTDKVSTINNKRLVMGQSKLSFDSEDFNSSKVSQKGRLSIQHNLMDIFKSGKQVQLGVSITDIANKSKILGQNLQKEETSKMNLSQFKELKSTFKPRARNLTQMIKNSESKILNEGTNFNNSRRAQLFVDSDVESKMMASSFSHFLQRSGKIKRNERAYTQNFGLQ